MKRGAHFWTTERRAELRRRWFAGARDPVIAAELGTTANAIRVQRCKDGLVTRRIKRASIRDYTLEAIFRELIRRGVELPAGVWKHSHRERKLDPGMAGGHHIF